MTEALVVPLSFVDVHRQRVPTQWRYSVDAPLVFEVCIGEPKVSPNIWPEAWLINFGRAPLVEALRYPGRHCGGASGHFLVRNSYTMEITVLLEAGEPPVTFFTAVRAVTAFVQGSLGMVPMCMALCCTDRACAECAWLRRDIPSCSCGDVDCPGW